MNAADVLARVDDGLPVTADQRVLLAVFERHCQEQAFIPPPALCVHGNDEDCGSCFLDHDYLMRRAEDQ